MKRYFSIVRGKSMARRSIMVAKLTNAPAIEVLDSTAILELDLDGIKLIEASAGTGKTHTIADLYLRHVLAGRLTSQILIVTYTNAATEELRGRIQNRLYQALTLLGGSDGETGGFLQLLREQWQCLDSATQQQQLRRLQLALRSLDEASISTIHSFCQRSLQEHAIAGKQLFDNDLLSDDDLLWEAAIKDWWRALSYDLDRDTWLLLRGELGTIEKLTQTLLQLRNKPGARLLPATRDLAALLRQPGRFAAELYQLAPQWHRYKSEIVEILTGSKVLSRAQSLPYNANRIDDWLDAADHFFNAANAGALFEGFQYLGTEWLNRHSKPSQRGKDSRLQHDFFKAVDAVARSWEEFSQNIGPQLRIDALVKVSRQVLESKREIAALAFQDQLGLFLEALESASGESMAQSLRRQYPVAMIDEFQDTDNIQYRIFEHIYHGAQDGSLTLIGDPKQAIYSFRGGDIFTYMQARKLPTIRPYNLDTNWRSQPDLVQAVNTLFSLREDAFIYSESIDFHAVSAIPDNARYQLLDPDTAAAMTLWQLPQTEQGENYTRAQMRELINQAIVIEITDLLDRASQGRASIDARPLQSGDIAILVRQASEGHALSRMLHRHGIRTVTIGRDSVFSSDEAHGLYDLLFAVSQCQDPAVAARSLASNLLHMDYREIAAIVDSDGAWQQWLENLSELQQLWERQGFIAMFQALLHRFDITRHLAQRDNSERRITNLLHLAELLQQQSLQNAGMASLLSWLLDQFDARGSEEAELRLEDDEALVKIVTIHKSKGLQYPVVFAPFLWSCRPVQRGHAISFHDAELTACIDLGSVAIDDHWLIAEKERLAEDLRLLYVALTRARSRLYLAWGMAGSSSKSGYASQTALAYLLHSRQTPADLDSVTANGFPEDMDFDADLQALVEKSAGTIERLTLPSTPLAASAYRDDATPLKPELAKFERAPSMQWRISSFTALTRGVHQPASFGTAAGGDDPILEFPAGSHVGLLMHSLLENLDFQQDVSGQCGPLFARFLAQAGLSSDHEADLRRWLENILQTPLDGASLNLNCIGRQQRLNELSFDFALDRLDVEALNNFLQERFEQPLQAIGSTDFRGLVTGVIDLVFEHRGRYYLADYKSNYLGSQLQDYAPGRLRQAMLDRRYDLQSMLYVLALHRLLRLRLPDYDYERHFGGSYYLFLRALRPGHGNRYGIYFDRPERKCIEQFEALFDCGPVRELSA
jgi:exodeoxyribonuclease V beta subunit